MLYFGMCVLLALLRIAQAHGHARERDYYFQRIGSAQGLSQNGVSVIFQGSRGFVWLGTQGGLHRFDGYRIKRFHHNPDHPGSLPNNLITALANAGHHRLWVGSRSGGLVLFDPERNRATRPPGHWSEHFDTVSALLGGNGKRLWIGTPLGIYATDPPYTSAQQLWQRQKKAPRRNLHLTACPGGMHYALSDGVIVVLGRNAAQTHVLHTDLVPDTLDCIDHTTLLAGTDSGLYRIDTRNGSSRRIWPKAGAAHQGNHAVRAVTTDHQHRIWLAVRNLGLVRLNRSATEARVLTPHKDVPGSVPDVSITQLMVDRSGLLWLGTLARGAAYANPDGTPFQYIFDPTAHGDPTTANNVRALYQDKQGRYWIGLNGAGVRIYTPATRQFTSLRPQLSRVFSATEMKDLLVFGIQRADATHLWLATLYGAISINIRTLHVRRLTRADIPTPRGAPDIGHMAVFSLLHAHDGSWWFGLTRKGLLHAVPGQPMKVYHHRKGAPDSLANDTVVTLTEDASHRIWIGTADGLSMYDPRQASLRSFRERAGRRDSLSGRVVLSIYQDPEENVWIGTQTGLSRLEHVDAAGAHFKRYLVGNQLPDNTIYCMRADAQNRLWISTNLGAARFDPDSGATRVFSMRDGLQGMEFNTGACMRTTDGHLLFGGINGISQVHPGDLTAGAVKPKAAITHIQVGVGADASARPDSHHVSMHAADMAIRFDFAVMDFAAPHLNRFQYRLLGFDRKWIDAGTRNSATYTNLDSGRYQFQVRGSTRDGPFDGAIKSVALTVVPPWWKSRAMLCVYVLLLLMLLIALGLIIRARRAVRRRHEHQLLEREARLSTALWGSGDEFWDIDLAAGQLHRLHARHRHQSKHNQSSISVEDWRNYVVHPEDLVLVQEAVDAHLAGSTDHFEAEFRVRGPRHSWIWVRSRGKVAERDPSGHPVRLSGTSHETTRRRAEERERRIAAEVIRNMAEAVTVTGLDYHFVSINAAFTRMTGYSADDVVGKDAVLLNCVQQTDEHYQHARREVEATGHWHGELWQRRKNGSEFLCRIEMSEVLDANGVRTHYVAVMSDITHRKRAEQELRYLANYDMLTGLPNRTLLSERLSDTVLQARHNNTRVAVLYMDLDRFKHVNDSMGHATGDRLLKAAGGRLRQCLRENDTVARVGGDEFTMVLSDVDNTSDVEAVATKIITAFTEPVLLDNHQEILISPSIGVALYPEHSPIPDDLIKHADTAMYQAKERGRNTWMMYTEDMDADARLRATMASALRRALERDELSLVYQPKLALREQQIIGVEALLRWHSPRFGNVPPGVFIPLAEDSGLIVDIGNFVINQACADLAAWRRSGLDNLSMAVNMSMAQLQRRELPDVLRGILALHHVPPGLLELELTESMVMGNVEQSMLTLGELRAIGVTLSIDDFGTGYSSLAYLKRLPINALKIDQTFIDDITTEPDDEAITATIIAIGHSLGLNVVAEGVENIEQVGYLQEHDCDIIQGHWLSRPKQAFECLAFCLQHRQRHHARSHPALNLPQS